MSQDRHSDAPEGAICDPVTGVCSVPPRADGATTPGLVALPKNLRLLEVLEDEQGNRVDPEVLRGKMVGIYFSAGWCPPCRSFSPVLSKWAGELPNEVVIVFCSFDKSQQDMETYINGKGFLRLPYAPDSARTKCAQSFGVQALPTLVIVNGDTGAVVTTWGRSAVTKNPSGCLKEWQAGRHGVSWLQLIKPW